MQFQKKITQFSYKISQEKEQKKAFLNNNKDKIITKNTINFEQEAQQLLKIQSQLKKQDKLHCNFIKNKSNTEEFVSNSICCSYYESDCSSDDEEYSIWDDAELLKSGVNTGTFIDSRGTQLDFYQIYRLRSALYQPQYISRIDTIKEVQTISSHYNNEIPITKLKQQQSYLDTYFSIQNKDNQQIQQQDKQQKKINFINQNKKCLTERISRTQSQYVERNQILSIQQKNNQKMIQGKFNFSREKVLECLYDQQIRNDKQKDQEVLKQNINQQQNSISKIDPQIYKLNNNNNRPNQGRQILRIERQQVQSKQIPIKQITLQDNSLQQDDFSLEISPQSNLIQNQKKNVQSYKISELYIDKNNKQNESINVMQTFRKQSISDAAQSVIYYLKQIVSSQ
ncbi:hypothetical protein ABPG74_012080 [Tetrahymena malaccensis]